MRAYGDASGGVETAERKLGTTLSTYSNMAEAQMAYFERSAAGCIRFQSRGTSEILLVRFEIMAAVLGTDDMAATFFQRVQNITQSEVEKIRSSSGGHVLHTVLAQGEVLVTSAGYVVVERATGAALSNGVRQLFLSKCHKCLWEPVYNAVSVHWKTHPHSAQMQSVALWFAEQS